MITLSKVTHSARLSQETPAFAATVCWKGIPFATVDNGGRGGCHLVNPIYSKATGTHCRAAYESAMGEIKNHLATLPEATYVIPGSTVPSAEPLEINYRQTLETLIDDALERHLQSKQLAKLLKSHAVYYRPSDGSELLLNGMPFERALDIYLRGSDLWQKKRTPSQPVRRPVPPVAAQPNVRAFAVDA